MWSRPTAHRLMKCNVEKAVVTKQVDAVSNENTSGKLTRVKEKLDLRIRKKEREKLGGKD